MHDDAQTTITPAVEYSFPSMEHLLCLVHLADALSQAIDPSKTGMDVSRYDRITKNFNKLARNARITPLQRATLEATILADLYSFDHRGNQMEPGKMWGGHFRNHTTHWRTRTESRRPC
eukprot:gb/GECG01015682.1/.p1 GENE.gb/GECG01015682.1/~~gb/GECG01015682.1/.p1  ORF type:complete len:119 (+),score=6.08 gb/GECG01015682.1/:1-357(+)